MQFVSLPRATHQVLLAVARIPQRIRNPRFWQVQALVAVATMAHYGVEIAGYTSPEGLFHDFAITLYIIPLLYAALSFGWEGAFMTAIWACILTSPSTWIWHHSELHWIAEVGQLLITMCVGILVAWRVDMESRQRRIAERTSARLSLLNKAVENLSHTLEVEQHLPGVLKDLQSSLGLEAVVLCLQPESVDSEPLFFEEGSGLSTLVRSVAARTDASAPHAVVRVDDRTVLVRLITGSGPLGCLGARALPNEVLDGDRLRLIETIGNEIRVAVENVRLYRQRQESLQSYVRQVTQAQEDERLRIARELHDDTAQELIHLVRKLEQLALKADPKFASQAEEDVGIARGILRSVRRFSRDLRPSILDDLGLIAAIEMVVDETKDLLPKGASLQVCGEPRRLEPPVELALFRIAQEALRNVYKHAGAQTAAVEIKFDGDDVSLAVSDDGSGFAVPGSVADLARQGKLGIMGMKERAELVGGTFELQGRVGKGTRIVARVRQPAARPA